MGTVMSQAATKRLFTLAEYLAIEPEGNVRHEFVDGELYAMTGMSRAHNAIVTRLSAALYSHLRGTPCRVAANDMKVVILEANRGYYPDLVVSCNDPAQEIDEYTESHPRLIVEVLSPSTEAIDRGRKRRDYQTLDSLQDYVLIAQSQPQVDVYRRTNDGWAHTAYRRDDRVWLASIDLSLPVAMIYENVPDGDDPSE